MYQEFYDGNQLLDLPIVAMLLFAVTFSFVVYRVWRSGSDNQNHSRLAQLPLEDDVRGGLVDG